MSKILCKHIFYISLRSMLKSRIVGHAMIALRFKELLDCLPK
jgi:hypothetical protein